MPQAVALVTGATGIRDVTDLTLVDADGTEPEPESESECGGSDPELTDTGSLGFGWIGLGWIGLGWIGLGWIGLGWIGLGWIGLGWIGLGWIGLGWIGLGFGFFPCSRSLIGRPFLVLPTCPPS